MEGVYALLIVSTIVFLAILIRQRYIEWQEDRRFWRQVDKMIEDNNKMLNEAFEKFLLEGKPFFVDMVKKKFNNK
jgi:hypothetical protein